MVKDAYNNDNQSKWDTTHPDVQDLFFLRKCILDNYMYFEYDRSTINKLSAAELHIRKYEIQQLIVSKFEHGNKILFHGRFWDDGFVAFYGTESETLEFFDIGNNC